MPEDSIGQTYHPGAPHIRIKPSEAPKDRTGQEADSFGGDFEKWALSGDWEQVSSSTVAAIAYDAKQQMIKIRYLSGESWGYYPYTMAEARGLYITGSKGVWLHDYVRMRGKGNQSKHQRSATSL